MNRYGFLILFVALFGVLTSVQADDLPSQAVLENIANKYMEAFNTGDMTVIEPLLAEDFTFMGQPPDVSKIVLSSVLSAKALTIDEVLEVSAEKKDMEIVLNMKLKIQGGIETDDMVSLQKKGNEFLISEMGQGIMQPMVIQDPVEDMEMEISGRENSFVKLIENPTHLLVPVQIGDSTHTFILDSGAPMTIVSSKYKSLFESFGGQALVSEAKGVGGDIGTTGDMCSIESMDIGGMVFSGVTAMTMDLAHLETALEMPFTGLIGADIIGKVLVTVDYEDMTLYLDRYDAKDKPLLREPPVTTIPFERKLHLVMVDGKLPGMDKGIKLTIDSGAGAGLISDYIFKDIDKKYIEIGESDSLMGAGTEVSVIETQFLKPLTVGGIERDDYPIISSDLSALAVGGENLIEGLVGLNFFQNYLITMNYKDNQIELRNLQKE